MAKHWTKYLPDIGRALFFKAENQELLTARINRLENEIKSEYNAEEKYLTEYVKSDWTDDEINMAICKSIKEEELNK